MVDLLCVRVRNGAADMIKLWIDDLRSPPDSGWVWAKSSKTAIQTVVWYAPELVSFDHDLGGDDTAMKVVDELEAISNESGTIRQFNYQIHSANPVGKANLHRALDRWFARMNWTNESGIGVQRQHDSLPS